MLNIDVTVIPAWLWHSAWHGFRGAVVAGASTATGIVVATKSMPANWEWVVIGAAILVGFVNGAESGQSEPM